MKQCPECQRLRHELAQIDVYCERYEREVNEGLDVREVRRRAVLLMGLICDRMSSLKNALGVPNSSDREPLQSLERFERILSSPLPTPARRSSLATLFEFRAQPKLVKVLITLLGAVAAAASWWVTHHFISK